MSAPEHDDGRVSVPPMTMKEQLENFAGFVAGYSFATGADLWAICDGPTLGIDDPQRGTRSHRIYRAGLLNGPDLNAACRALLDSRPTWPKAEPLGDLPPDAEVTLR